jgi:hypothetical protein
MVALTLLLQNKAGGDDAAALSAGMREYVAHELHTAALPRGVQHFCDGPFDALMRVGDH